MKHGHGRFSWYLASGSSMFPLIRENDFVLVKDEPADRISKGDVILFESKNVIKVCHEVASVGKIGGRTFFFAKGYNKALNECEFVGDEGLLGKVVAVKRGRKVIYFPVNRPHYLYFSTKCAITAHVFKLRRALSGYPFLRKIYGFVYWQWQVIRKNGRCVKKRFNMLT